MRLQQQAQLNAPDPRDTHPPAYEEAIRMPKPFFYSMDELSTNKKQKRRKRRQLQEENEAIEEVDSSATTTHRFHSEEVGFPQSFISALQLLTLDSLPLHYRCSQAALDRLHDFIRLRWRRLKGTEDEETTSHRSHLTLSSSLDRSRRFWSSTVVRPAPTLVDAPIVAPSHAVTVVVGPSTAAEIHFNALAR